MKTLQKLLDDAIDYRMQDETMEKFLSLMTPVRLKNKESLIPYGKSDNNLYIVKEGIIRFAYLDDAKDKTYAFAAPGTLMICSSFYNNYPSFFNYEACCESVVMKMTKADFEELLKESDDFKNWMLRMSLEQIWDLEKKAVLTSGTAKERFKTTITDRPVLLEKVPVKVIASYIDVSPQYMSTTKNDFMKKSGKKHKK